MIKVKVHLLIMPWQIDLLLLSYIQLKKSFGYISKDVEVTIDTHLNLSSYVIDWDKSDLPKEFFINKYNELAFLLNDYKHNSSIYEGEKNYGILDMQRLAYGNEFDYYIPICPDIEFDEYLLSNLIESARLVSNKYFVITPEIYKKWDETWDDLTNEKFRNIPYRNSNDELDVFKIRKEIQSLNENILLEPSKTPKWAIWFDIYSKSFYEELCPIYEEWKGYGPWDLYSIIISGIAKNRGADIGTYILRDQIILDYLKFTDYYKDLIKVKITAQEQRKIFEDNLPYFLNKTLQTLQNKQIIK